MQLQVLSGKTGTVVELELLRADAEEVKLHRALSDWLAHIRDNSTSGLALSEAPHPSCHVAFHFSHSPFLCVWCLVCACQCVCGVLYMVAFAWCVLPRIS